MAYKVIILYQLYMPSYFLGTFTEYPTLKLITIDIVIVGPLHSDILFLHPNSFAYYRKAE